MPISLLLRAQSKALLTNSSRDASEHVLDGNQRQPYFSDAREANHYAVNYKDIRVVRRQRFFMHGVRLYGIMEIFPSTTFYRRLFRNTDWGSMRV